MITFIKNSTFLLDFKDIALIIDYYEDKDDIVKNFLANNNKDIYFLNSHSHADHFSKSIMDISYQGKLHYIFSSDIYDEFEISDANYLEKFGEFKDNNLLIKAFGSTDLGISFYIEVEGKKIFHAGDLNNWHWKEEADAHHAKIYEDNFLSELSDIKNYCKRFDMVFFPLDKRLGEEFYLGAIQFLQEIHTNCFIGMHMR